jgi:hypothetical protein
MEWTLPRVGTILLANGSNGAGVTDGTGGQGVKPLPMTHDGWIQPMVALLGTEMLSPEVEGWFRLLTPAQKDPRGTLVWQPARRAMSNPILARRQSVF